jgi:hypothetical protein
VAHDRAERRAARDLPRDVGIIASITPARVRVADASSNRRASTCARKNGSWYAARPSITPSTTRAPRRSLRQSSSPPFSTIVSAGKSRFRRGTTS